MLDLSPTKLIIIFVVGIVLLGPKRLPQVAHQLGVAWAKLRTYSHRIDTELRQSMPDLPTSRDIVRYARSPITLLNELADGTSDDFDAFDEDPADPAIHPSDALDGAPAGGSTGDGPWPQGPTSSVPASIPAASTVQHARSDERGDLQESARRGELAPLAVDDPTFN